MDGKDFNKLTTEYTEKYLKDSVTFKKHLEDLEKSLMNGKSSHEPMPNWQKLALMAVGMVIDITDQDKIMSLAVSGEEAAELTLGVSYLEGVHVGKDFKKALFWLNRASKNNLPMAHFCIGVIYYEGLGIGYDFNISINSFKKSIELGIADEPGYSGWNGIIAEAFIGEMYFMGGYGITEDNMQALKWLIPAAELNDMKSQYYVGCLYDTDKVNSPYSIETNNKIALGWFSKAAEQGHLNSINHLGVANEYGRGTPQDYEMAYNWYLDAASNGLPIAQTNLAKLYFHGYWIAQNFEIAAKWLEKAANENCDEAQVALGIMNLEGLYFEQSNQKAAAWINLARKNGNKQSEELWNEHKLWQYELN